jgi:hypothetical protein
MRAAKHRALPKCQLVGHLSCIERCINEAFFGKTLDHTASMAGMATQAPSAKEEFPAFALWRCRRDGVWSWLEPMIDSQ